MERLTSLSVVFPAYNDEYTIGKLVRRAAYLLPQLAGDYEIIVVNDGSTDTTGEVLARLQRKISFLRIITHEQNQGYGAALISGFKAASKECIFYTDGDGQYDVGELPKLVSVFNGRIDIVTGFKRKRSDPWFRKIVGMLYNEFVKVTFRLPVADVDCDFRLFQKKILKGLTLRTRSGAFDAEFIKKLSDKGVRFREVPIHHYPRKYGKSQFFHLGNISKSIWDVGRLLVSA